MVVLCSTQLDWEVAWDWETAWLSLFKVWQAIQVNLWHMCMILQRSNIGNDNWNSFLVPLIIHSITMPWLLTNFSGELPHFAHYCAFTWAMCTCKCFSCLYPNVDIKVKNTISLSWFVKFKVGDLLYASLSELPTRTRNSFLNSHNQFRPHQFTRHHVKIRQKI